MALTPVFKTLAYADVFDFPLTAGEVKRFLISSRRYSLAEINQALRQLPCRDNYYFLPGRQAIVDLRKKREVWSQQKMGLARRVGEWLKLVPTIKMVAVTGALAMANAQKNDDIDLLIVSRAGTLWLTRLLTVLLAELVSHRRRPGDQQVKDKICLNMFLDEAHLALPSGERNLYTAHEVVQAKLLWDRDGTYQQFIKKNLWFQKYLGNWKPSPAGCN